MIKAIFSSLKKRFFVKSKQPLSKKTYDLEKKDILSEKEHGPSLKKTEESSKNRYTSPKKKKWEPELFDVPVVEGKSRFHDFKLSAKLMRGIHELGFEYCTPVQAAILPDALEGRDAIARAQTGTGKSAAFLLVLYSRLMRKPRENPRPGVPRALILAPTRELVLQLEKDARAIGKYSPIKVAAVFGGMAYEKQKSILANQVFDILVATPGRLLDFKNQGLLRLYKLEMLVIDEADRMLDMGFIPEVRQIVYESPKKEQRQTLFFSATFSENVLRLADRWTLDPIQLEIETEVIAKESILRKNYIVTEREKFFLLWNIITKENLKKVLVFTNKKSEAGKLAKTLISHGISTAVFSGDINQSRRISALEGFRKGTFKVLVATDVAARGIHVEGISHVVNYNLPQDPEQFVHRIGRTGRAGAFGVSISFADEMDSFYIPAIEEYIEEPFVCEYPEESYLVKPPPPSEKSPQKKKRRYVKKTYTAAGEKEKNFRKAPSSKGSSERRYKKKNV